MALVVRCNNGIVTDEYLNLIGKSLEESGVQVNYTSDFSEALKLDKDEIVVVARTVEAYKLIKNGYKKVVVWFQGIEPEESYMAHHSKLRYWILSHMERVILKKGLFFIFVSEEMVRHYERKYKQSLDRSVIYIMPCQNTIFHSEAFIPREKYSKNVFAYTGSLAVWQKFEDTVGAYKKIEEAGIPDCELWIYTSEQEEAKKIVEKYGIQHYKIGFVKSDELPMELSQAKYGFIIREDTPVNRVATPTKISTYLSCGLIPIYSDCLAAFSEIAKTMRYAIRYDENYIVNIKKINAEGIKNEDVLLEYQQVYSEYFDSSLHQDKLTSKFTFLKRM